MILTDIYPEFSVENGTYESKVRLDRDNILGWLKTIAGFSNAKGGYFVVGVEDKTNKLIGFALDELDKEKLFFYNQIKEHFDTLPEIESNTVGYEINGNKRYILIFHILESHIKPVILKMQGAPLIYMRRDGYTNYATVEEIMKMAKYSINPKYDKDKTDITFDFNNFTKLKQFYFENTQKELTIKDLESINFYDENNKLYKGSNLFRDDYDGKDLHVVFCLYEGFTRGDNVILSTNEFKGNAIDCYKFLYDNVNFRMNHGFVKKDTTRVDTDAYPKRSLFEAIINSIAHKDYYIEGSSIYVNMFKDRLVISSPGSPYGMDELDKTYNFSSFASKRRNELICAIFVLCHAMEAKGTGFEKIIDDYKNQDEKHKPFIYSKNNQFSIVLPDLTYSEGVNVDNESIVIQAKINNTTRFDISVLSYCFSSSHSTKEISEYLNISNSTYLRKQVIANLVNQSFLLESKKGNKVVYSTNKDKVSLK